MCGGLNIFTNRNLSCADITEYIPPTRMLFVSRIGYTRNESRTNDGIKDYTQTQVCYLPF